MVKLWLQSDRRECNDGRGRENSRVRLIVEEHQGMEVTKVAKNEGRVWW